MTYHLCPVCHKPASVNGGGHMTATPKPFGGWCRCGGVPAILAERDRLRAENETARALLREARSRFIDYQMDVDEPPPFRHRDLMNRIDAALPDE